MNDNKVIVPWSYSKLSAFELCPKKMYHEQIKKDFKQDGTTDIQAFGIDGHKQFENYMINDKNMSIDFMHHKKHLDKIKGLTGMGMGEQKLAINKDYMPTGWFDSDVYARCVIDYGKLNEEKKTMVVVDWKFGKRKDDFDQVKLMIAMMSCYYPDIEIFIGMYYWAKEKKISKVVIRKKEIMQIWNDILPRVNELEEAVLSSEFPAQQNFLCGKYCPVKICVYNGG